MKANAAHPAYHHHGIAGTSSLALPAHWLDTEHLFPSRRQALLDGMERGVDSVDVQEGTLHPRLKRVRGRTFSVWELVPREHRPISEPGIYSHIHRP